MKTRAPHQLVIDAFRLYRRYPLLFFVLATAVVVPYEVIMFVATGTGPFDQSSLSLGVGLLLMLSDFALIGPLVSALHVHAVAAAREGTDPRLGSVAREGLRVLPTVAAASIIAWLGISLGVLALIIPGIYLALRWFVVAQAAAIEHEGWLPAIRRSACLTNGHYSRLLILSIYIALITSVPVFLIGLGFADDSTTVVSFLVGAIVQTFAWSFGALVTALAYFDLRGRYEASHAQEAAGDPGPTGSGPRQGGGSWDPRTYSEAERPSGWYVDAGAPGRMRYWDAADPPRWGATTKTPQKIRQAWEEAKRDGSS